MTGRGRASVSVRRRLGEPVRGASGWKKVGHKARNGRRRRPVPHGSHRKGPGLADPLSRAMKRERLRRAREDAERVERAAW